MAYAILILISYLAEVLLLFFLEWKIWKSVYTPLNILMLPYTAVMLISISAIKPFHFYPFYYDSILVWSVGLLFFAMPSWFYSLFLKGSTSVSTPRIAISSLPFPFLSFCLFMLILAIYGIHIMTVLASTLAAIGSDEFADESSNSGLWGHMFNLVMAFEIISFIYLSRKNWYFIFVILFAIIFCVINQVKGWVLIPLITGILLKIYTGKLHINLRLVLTVIIGGFSFFFLSYYLSLAVSENKDLTDDITFFIFKNFFHYLSSGVLALSMDLDLGILEQPDLEYLFGPFSNIWHTLNDEPTVSNLNPYYMGTTWEGLGANIRTFLGTIFVYSRYYFPIIVMIFSTAFYTVHYFMVKRGTMILLLIDAWLSAIFFMGWFDYYFALLTSYEIIIIFIIFHVIVTFFSLNNQAHAATK